MLGLVCCCLLAAPANLVANPSFEDGDAPWQLPRNYAVDADVGREGQASLKVVNGDPAVYRLATQPIAMRSGMTYEFSAWVRTEHVTGDDTGATICMEWSGPDGWLGGDYPAGVKGTADWTEVRGLTRPIPDEATRLQVTLYLRRGNTGTAWFDEVRVVERYPKPMTAQLLAPGYRGWLAADRPAGASVRFSLAHRLPGDADPATLTRRLRLLAGDREVASVAVSDDLAELRLPPLPAGRYDLAAELLDGAVLLDSTEFELEARRADSPPPRVWIDDAGRTIADSEPIFPLGMYDSHASPEELRQIAAAGYNCVMPYGLFHGDVARARGYLDAAQAAGLKVIASVKDFYDGTHWRPERALGESTAAAMTERAVTTFRDHPAVLAWYCNDELPVSYHDVLRERYRQVRELDPDHPCWIVLYQVGQLGNYTDTTDVLGTDPYPVGRGPLSAAGQWTRQTRAAAGPRGGVWQVPQAHDWGNYDQDRAAQTAAPTLAQLRCMTYQCLAEGAMGLIYYSYFDLKRDKLGLEARMADMTALAAEVRQAVPFLLAAEPTPDVGLRNEHQDDLFARVWSRDGALLALVANGSNEATRRLTWRLPGPLEILAGEASEAGPERMVLAPEQAIMVRCAGAGR